MSLKLLHNGTELHTNKILWDRDSYFINFYSYWSRVVGSIAQYTAEQTTDNWGSFNLVRTETIKTLGISQDNLVPELSAPVLILPVSVFPSLISTSIKRLVTDIKYEKLNELLHGIIKKALADHKEHIKDSITFENLKLPKEINKDINQVIVTNDSNENNSCFLNEAKLENLFSEVHHEANKEQLNDLLKNDTVFITKNSYLSDFYSKQGYKNILLVKDLSKLTCSVDNDSLIYINIDGASRGNPGPAAIGIAFYKNNELFDEKSEYIGNQTNNFAEYTALIKALEVSVDKGFKNIEIRSDSELVVKQINKIYKIKDADIKDLVDKANTFISKIPNIKITHIRREDNLRADKLANNALNAYLK